MSGDPYLQLTSVGPCRLIARIGEGGMGVVYRGHHRELELDVAVKFLHPHLTRRSDHAERFLREARLAARLNHPGIVRVFDCGVADDQYYIVMEFVDGHSVHELIRQQGSLPPARALAITASVARALCEAWNRTRLIHRDVKPHNVILSASGDVKLADLGLARTVVQESETDPMGTTAPGTLLGTPNYMSPEQFLDPGTVDHRADMFSLGATLHHMLSGRPPFEGKNFFDVQRQIEEGFPQPLPSHVSHEVEQLVLTMLARNPDDRFRTYEELIETIEIAGNLPGSMDTAAALRTPRPSGQTAIPQARSPGRILRPATPTEQRVLLVVDVQNDFCPGGSLSVPRGNEIVPVINDLAARFSHVILTQDWHRPDHLSFASSHPGEKPLSQVELSYGPQILWPDHCIQGTPGAEIHPGLRVPQCELVIRKGYNREIDSYSAFFENDRQTPTGLAGYLRERGLKKLFIVGLATDFCVAYSALDARRLGFEVTVIENACRGIDIDGSLETAWQQMLDVGVVRA